MIRFTGYAWMLLGGLLLLVLAGCGDEALPNADTMTLRELLGLSSERAAELAPDARVDFAQRLLEAWSETSAERDPHDLILTDDDDDDPEGASLRIPLDFARAHDLERVERDLEVLVAARLDARGDEATLRGASPTPEALGLTRSERGLLALRPLGEDEATLYQDALYFDEETWGRDAREAFDGDSEHDRVVGVEPLVRRFLGALEIDASAVQVVAAPRAPLIIWYAAAHRAVLINPNLLLLLDVDGPAPPSGLRTQSQALTLDFIEACVEEERTRCDACTLANDEEAGESCVPVFDVPLSEDPRTQARRECSELNRAEGGFELFCYNRLVDEHLTCMLNAGVERVCSLERAPARDLESLWLLEPMRLDERCQYTLLSCYDRQDSRQNPPPTPPPPPDFPRVYQEDDLDDDSCDFFLAFDACSALGNCDDAGDEATDDDTSSCGSDDDSSSDDDGGMCEGSDDDSSSDDDSGVCEGDDSDSDDDSGGICEGDDDEQSSELRSAPADFSGGDLFVALALGFLALVWRREEDADEGVQEDVA